MGRGYSIAFLERRPKYENDTKIFVPADFAEMSYSDNKTDEILAEICDLQQLAPLESASRTASVCPVVSTAAQCIRVPNTTTSTTWRCFESRFEKSSISGTIANVLDSIRSKAGTVQVDVDMKNGLVQLQWNLFLIIMMILILQWN